MQAQSFSMHVSTVAAESPRGLVLDWWRRLDMTIDDYFLATGADRPKRPAEVEAAIAKDARFPCGLASEVRSLRLERNRVAHQVRSGPSPSDAAEYAHRAFAAIGEFFSMTEAP